MTTTENNLQLGGKDISLPDYLTTLEPTKTAYEAKLNFDNYSDLAVTLEALLSVCQTSLLLFEQNSDLIEYEKERHLGGGSYSVHTVLKVAKSLIPFAEMELLDKLQEVTFKTDENADW